MRALTAPETAALLSGVTHFRVEAKRATDAAWTNLSAVYGGDWVFSAQTEQETVDAPVGRFSITLLKREGSYSTAPGMSASPFNINASLVYKPLVYPGSYFRVYTVKLGTGVTPAPGDLRLWLEGRARVASWSENVIATCDSLDAIIERTQIEVPETRGLPDPGVPVEDEIQGLLDRWLGPGVVTLRVVGVPDWGVGEYTPAGSLGEQIRTLAQEHAWDVRYLWSDADGAYRYTLYLPPRDKVTIDLALTKADLLPAPDFEVSSENVRNAIAGEAIGADGTLITAPVDEDTASIADFGRLWMKLSEGVKSSIKTLLQLTTLQGYAKSDLAQPPVGARIRIPFVPWLGLHDRLSYAADGQNWDFPTSYSVVGVSHSVQAVDSYTELDLRAGSPVGMFYAWHARKGATSSPGEDTMTERKVGRTNTDVTLKATLSARVVEVWAYEELVDEPFDPEEWPDVEADTPVATYSAADFTADGHTALIPSENRVRLVILVTKDAAGTSLHEWRYPVYPTRPDPTIVDVAVTNQLLQVIGGPGVQSIRMAHRGGTWVAFYDAIGLTINVSLSDADGHAGIGAGETWTVDVNAYGVPKSEVSVGVTPSAEKSMTVYGSGVDPVTEPQWEVILATAPADLDSVMTIRLRAGNVTAETAKLYAKYNTGTGWSSETEITGSVSPALTTAPSSNTDYTWDCGFVRSDDDPRPSTVTFQIRAELLDGLDVVDNDWDEVSFTAEP